MSVNSAFGVVRTTDSTDCNGAAGRPTGGTAGGATAALVVGGTAPADGIDEGDAAAEAPAVGVASERTVSATGATTGARRDDGKSIGVATMTSAMRSSATSVRLSIQAGGVAREQDHSRPDETDGNGRFDEGQASHREWNHVAEALRWHTRSSLDNNGTRQAGAETASPDTLERAKRERSASIAYARESLPVTRD